MASAASGHLQLRDGSRLPIADGMSTKTFAAWLDAPGIADMFRLPYLRGRPAANPAKDSDPGRARNAALFEKLYGRCQQGEVEKNLVQVDWLSGKNGGKIRFNKRQGAAAALAAVSRDLDKLPDTFTKFLVPAGGGYVCRPIAGTDRVSAHGYGIAIDIAVKPSHYWRWGKADASGAPIYQNAIPFEIVDIFERHGFIWGGKWYHYDTMHFEYRPELIKPQR